MASHRFLGVAVVSVASLAVLAYILLGCNQRSNLDDYESEGGMRTKIRHEVNRSNALCVHGRPFVSSRHSIPMGSSVCITYQLAQ